MLECPDAALKRLAPDGVQLQIMVGSLLGSARVTGGPRERRLVIAHERDAYTRWKYERLGAFAAEWPVRQAGLTRFTTIAHPLFDDLARLGRNALLDLTGPLALAVWLTDLGRMELAARSA